MKEDMSMMSIRTKRRDAHETIGRASEYVPGVKPSRACPGLWQRELLPGAGTNDHVVFELAALGPGKPLRGQFTGTA